MSEQEKQEPVTVANSGTGGRPGIKTTEFWVMLVMTVLGAWIVERGHDEIGAAIIALAGSGYTGSRAWLKHRDSKVQEAASTPVVDWPTMPPVKKAPPTGPGRVS